MLDQRGDELVPLAHERVADVLGRLRSGYEVDGRDVTPAQLLERLGFAGGQLSARVNELSGGQRRRLQLMLTVLAEPNVLLLDEPTNDVDTDMLAATEDLLDSWPGTLIVVSHDRYLMERVTDQQYAILDGRLRHLPGGMDEYLRLAAQANAQRVAAAAKPSASQEISGADLRSAQKEIAAIDRRLARLAGQIEAKHRELADHDQSDHIGIAGLTGQLRELESDVAGLEKRWMEVSDVLE
jgi:ABC-type multidrug transport system ATPase subunit